ncbi:hypothetical protein K437DRAFT_54461 [Tilletiaria anomala UBC 951]|uniref:Uncharacterized protein n=1 Tax=Tilletiaria anomala (strain ATCC 24038 / CBS 436.72 / UBC 951) TaxID=1037660 RepID=A0A066V453_TILAU|nr:uncharacterized protein K437DRAFT_54461 [Tilletiaria anomala UBC 951]KDN36492.1 hypothetical protein K437DRAFT_54461 [Tilletiaria anomala UBC 951]
MRAVCTPVASELPQGTHLAIPFVPHETLGALDFCRFSQNGLARIAMSPILHVRGRRVLVINSIKSAVYIPRTRSQLKVTLWYRRDETKNQPGERGGACQTFTTNGKKSRPAHQLKQDQRCSYVLPSSVRFATIMPRQVHSASEQTTEMQP